LQFFYIQLIIREKYQAQGGKWKGNFYKSRAARIYPLYFLVTVPFFVLYGNDWFTQHWRTHDVFGVTTFLVTNTIIVCFGSVILYNPIFVPYINTPVWSISIELTFYFLAPFLLRRSTTFVTLLAMILVLSRVACMRWLADNPAAAILLFPEAHFRLNPPYLLGWWPFELSLFLAGALSYRFYAFLLLRVPGKGSRKWITTLPWLKRQIAVSTLLYVMSGVVWAGFLRYLWRDWALLPNHIGPLSLPAAYWAVIFVTVLALPFAFHFTRFVKWDRYMGELSYPLYLAHFPVIELVKKYSGLPQQAITPTIVGVTVFVSVVAWWLVEVPVTQWRHRRFEKRHEECLRPCW
jgi:peptidoglycan/LPS O-acetylase OafA/YrhL